MNFDTDLFQDIFDGVEQYRVLGDLDYSYESFFDETENDHYASADLVFDDYRFTEGEHPIYNIKILVEEHEDDLHNTFKADFRKKEPNINGNYTRGWRDISENPVEEDHAFQKTVKTQSRAKMLLTAEAEKVLPDPDEIHS